jgi:hypothetical protein
LDVVDAGLVERCKVVGWGYKLGAFTVDWFIPGMWCVFGSIKCGVLELVEGAFDVARHGQVDRALVVVPGECDATVKGTTPVSGRGDGAVDE